MRLQYTSEELVYGTDMVKRSNYQTAANMSSCHPPCINKMSNISLLQLLEDVNGSDGAASGTRLMLRQEQRRVGQTMDLMA